MSDEEKVRGIIKLVLLECLLSALLGMLFGIALAAILWL